ncbi:MAG: EAL domain-containing protein [Cucumibacter sp.]
MPARFLNILMLVSAMLAFAPVLAVDWLLDGYVSEREGSRLQTAVDQASRGIESSVESALGSLIGIIAASPSLCSPSFLARVQDAMQQSPVLRQVIATTADGVQLCDGFGREFAMTPLSAAIPIAGRVETITVVALPGQPLPALMVSAPAGEGRQVSGFVPVNPQLDLGLPETLRQASVLRIALTDGTEIATFGDPSLFDRPGNRPDFIVAEAMAGDIPIRAEAAVPLGLVRTGYADLDIGFTLVACLISGTFLWLVLLYARRVDNPGFELNRAIARGHLRPRYQPVVNLTTGRVEGCEVLIRWEKPTGEVVSPGAFIDYAEMSGLAIPMTLSLMRQVRDDLEPLCREQPQLKISINLFEGHFRDGTIVEDVVTIFDGSAVQYEQLVFEITERQPLEDKKGANATIAGLHRLGCKVALDDAGTGHSNLSYLQELGIDIVKIDRVFTDFIKVRTDTVPVVDGLISMARDLKMEVIAEGVETVEQALYLKAKGVTLAQGYLFARPLTLGDYEEMARRMNAVRKVAADELLGAAASAA